MDTVLVELDHVTKTYGTGAAAVRALDEVSLTVRRREFLSLAGPSGSGKTTLLNVMGGLDTVDSGKVRVQGRDLAVMRSSALADLRLHQVGFVFQAYNLIPVLSAVENVEYVMLLQGVRISERREKAMQILAEVGLSGLEHRRPARLSGGQQQRVAVARAIVSGPALVLADEPTANLDSRTGEELLDLMRAMNRERGTTFVFSTHDRMVIDRADRRVFLRDGRVVGEEGLRFKG